MHKFSKANEKGQSWAIDTRIQYYFIRGKSSKRGCNEHIIVYRKRRDGMEYVGSGHYHSASWRGASPSAVMIASNAYNHRNNGSDFIDKNGERSENISVLELHKYY